MQPFYGSTSFQQLVDQHASALLEEARLAKELEMEFQRIKAAHDSNRLVVDPLLDAACRLAFRSQEAIRYQLILRELDTVLRQYWGQPILVHLCERGLEFWFGRIREPFWSVCGKRLALKFHTGNAHFRYSREAEKVDICEGDIEAGLHSFLLPTATGPHGLLQNILNGHGSPESAAKSWLGKTGPCQCPNTVPHLSIGEVNVSDHLAMWADQRLLIGPNPWEVERMMDSPKLTA